MNEAEPDHRSMISAAVAALKADDAGRARQLFERVVAAHPGDLSSWLGLAFACARLGDNPATLSAVDQALKIDPQNLRALIFKGDHLEQTGQARRSLRFYQAALRSAARARDLPGDVQQGLERARAVCRRFDEEYEAYLRDKLAERGFRQGRLCARFEQSLDIASGRKSIFFQQPRRYFFPGLPQIQFYERDQFPWLEIIEAATDDIRAELLAVLNDPASFKPYLEADADMPHLDRNAGSLIDSRDWGAFFLWDYGRHSESAAELCPKTLVALDAAPLPHIAGQAPMALFSRLAPKTRIPPHNGLLNTRLICHLPVVVPADCGMLRCGNEARPWVEGETLVFDDSIEHEAWNDSDLERIVLLFEVWRPELTDKERELVTAMLEIVKQYDAQ